MNTLFNSILKNSIALLVLAVMAYLINVGLYFYLPKEKTLIESENTKELEYKKYDFFNAVSVKEIPKVVAKVEKKKTQEYQLLSSITLIAIIDLGNGKGVITISEKSSRDTLILGINDDIKGYVLQEVYKDYVLFEKDNKQYRVTLNLEETPQFEIKKEEKVDIPVSEAIETKNDVVQVKRDYVNSYINDIDRVWKDIAINENKVDGKIDGFRIDFIAKNSAFEKLGLKKGDIIKSVNNIKLRSYNDAFKIYNKIDNTKSLQFTIERNKQEMEINYEIQ